ncbi:MAG: twin-arginine translocation pathway signal protein [Casimicrobiaceae bacterium]
MNSPSPGRRRFLLAAPAAVASAAALPAHAKDLCLVTDGDILGPFYRPGAKTAVKMVDAGVEGERLLLTGTVLRPDCKTPVAGASVDFWHCDHKGAYDIKTPDEKITPENFRFRAMAQTDKEGRFFFETIVPGRYGIPPGLEGFEAYAGQTRPAHFHLTVTHPIYLPLTSQIYMQGDPFIAKDPWANQSKLVMALKKGGAGATGRVEIVLANRPGQRRA